MPPATPARPRLTGRISRSTLPGAHIFRTLVSSSRRRQRRCDCHASLSGEPTASLSSSFFICSSVAAVVLLSRSPSFPSLSPSLSLPQVARAHRGNSGERRRNLENSAIDRSAVIRDNRRSIRIKGRFRRCESLAPRKGRLLWLSILGYSDVATLRARFRLLRRRAEPNIFQASVTRKKGEYVNCLIRETVDVIRSVDRASV